MTKPLGAGVALVALSAFVPNLKITERLADINFSFNPIGEAHAQATKQASLHFSAQVSNPLAMSLKANVKFGKFGIGGAGSIKMQPNGGGTTANNQVIVNASGANGVISVSAPNNALFSLSLTKYAGGNPIYMATSLAGGAGASPSKTMTITQIKVQASSAKMNGKLGVFAVTNPAVTGYAITVGKTGQLSVGTTIQIDGSEVPGVYRGSTIIVMSL